MLQPDEKLETFIGDAGRAKLTVLTKAMTIATSGYGDESSPYESDECDKRAASVSLFKLEGVKLVR